MLNLHVILIYELNLFSIMYNFIILQGFLTFIFFIFSKHNDPASIVANLTMSRIVCIGTYSILYDCGADTSFYAYIGI